jgi:hypothetical protein
LNSNARNAVLFLNLFVSGAAVKTGGLARRAAPMTARRSYQHSLLWPPVRERAWEAFRPPVHALPMAGFREVNLCSRELQTMQMYEARHWNSLNKINLKKEGAA